MSSRPLAKSMPSRLCTSSLRALANPSRSAALPVTAASQNGCESVDQERIHGSLDFDHIRGTMPTSPMMRSPPDFFSSILPMVSSSCHGQVRQASASLRS
eukprot:206095-Pyramimonas_sp.AAC.1